MTSRLLQQISQKLRKTSVLSLIDFVVIWGLNVLGKFWGFFMLMLFISYLFLCCNSEGLLNSVSFLFSDINLCSGMVNNH